ncbi:unnamed protein product [Brachionus calyciflorus]|uniref:Uncharacterized protein n=1 Tax=Brachionus calyciflorus TaxID=104777 RepID=A0A813MP98_9BILA|nr:unnamed protein product [Brachionus calyciflorus]
MFKFYKNNDINNLTASIFSCFISSECINTDVHVYRSFLMTIKDITGYYEDELGKIFRHEFILSIAVEESIIKLQLIENKVIKLEKDLVTPIEFFARKL